MKTTPWILEDGYFAYRALAGTDPEDVGNRVAAIEKTARVRVKPFQLSSTGIGEPSENWASGPRDSDYGRSDTSRAWCDEQLVLMGYELDHGPQIEVGEPDMDAEES